MADISENVGKHGRSIVLAPGAGRSIPLGVAGTVILKAVGAETGGTLSIYEFATPPKTAGPPIHLHQGWDEAFYVLEGEMTFLVGEHTHTAPAGSFVFIPRGVLHTFWNESAGPARNLTVFTPAGIEHYFEDATRVLAAGDDHGLDAATALMERHDMVVSPGTRPAYGALLSPELEQQHNSDEDALDDAIIAEHERVQEDSP